MASTDAKGVHLSERSAANKIVPVVEGRPGAAPKGLNKEAVAAWDSIVANAPDGWITALDIQLMEQYCKDWAMCRRILNQIEHEGFMVDSEGGKKPHPLFSVLFKAKAALLAESKELGFTPSARGRVRMGTKNEEQNDFSDF